MRKSLWMILVVFVFMTLGSTSARADTIVASGGNVTAINGITIAGTTYNVTFGTTIDTTFAGNASNASTANAAILADLNSDTYITAGGACAVGVDGGVITYYDNSVSTTCFGSGGVNGSWYQSSLDTVFYSAIVAQGNEGRLWDEFAVVPASTPEPGTLSLTLTGVGLLGLTLVLRKRKAHDLAQTT
jgi:hypothetical protein